jgi:peptidoglycan/LPS O-acetylase OafA/YrhL
VDVARGLAALSVAVYHYGFGALLVRLSGWSGFTWIAWPGYTIAVPLFFVISGFCIHLNGVKLFGSPRFTSRFLVQRFFRIYPPWLVAIALSAAVFRMHGSWPSSKIILSHLTLTNGFFDNNDLNPVLWSVSVEFLLYLLYPLWLTTKMRFGLGAAVAAAFLTSAVSCLLTAHWHPQVSGPTQWFFLNVWCGWIAGAVLADTVLRRGLQCLRAPRLWLLGIALVAAHGFLIDHDCYAGPWTFFRLPITICLCFWLLSLLLLAGDWLSRRESGAVATFLWRPLAWVGLFSYSLYLLHMPLQQLRFPISNALGGAEVIKGIIFLVFFALILGVSWCSYQWIERPSARCGKWISNRMDPAAPNL